MNKIRRNRISEVIQKIESLTEELELIKEEEDQYRDDMPENLQNGQKFEESEEYSNSMDEAIDYLGSAVFALQEIID